MKLYLSSEDVLIKPKFSFINSRKDVDTTTNFLGLQLKLPLISANMDTVSESKMCIAMGVNGAIGALHRFMDIDKNITMFKECTTPTIVSIGIGDKEFERAVALYHSGAYIFLLDVAHGASQVVVEQYSRLRNIVGNNASIIVGNFATAQSIEDFNYRVEKLPDSYKVGVGGGSACLTRIVTGAGLPTLGSVLDCAQTGLSLIADGGAKNSGDICKYLAAGAEMVMCGGLLAGTDESPGKVIWEKEGEYEVEPGYKKYRGSASLESYEVQGKVSDWRTAEGDSFLVPYKGPVKNVLQEIEAGLRSSMSYVGANNMIEFHENAELVQITNAGWEESKAHGKK